MSNLRRYPSPTGMYFLTSVTINRRPILLDRESQLLESLTIACSRFRTNLKAWVILPDHVHLVVESDLDRLPLFMKGFKRGFGMTYRQECGVTSGRVWQLRYWDHAIRNQEDLNRHLDYIHYNPVKHGFANSASDYPHSSFKHLWRQGSTIHHGDLWGRRRSLGSSVSNNVKLQESLTYAVLRADQVKPQEGIGRFSLYRETGADVDVCRPPGLTTSTSRR
ncbi:MAG: transposase [bacterium]